MSKISLDYNFATKVNISCGMSSEELELNTAKAMKGLSKLKELMDNDKVGFAKAPYTDLSDIKSLAKETAKKFNDLILIGIGGSALGAEALVNALLPYEYNSLSFADRKSFPRCWVLDNSDPYLATSILDYCDQEDTFVVVISKSGNTTETVANFSIVLEWLNKGKVDLKKHVAIITDPDKGSLRDVALANNFPMLKVPSNVGGRFSVLTSVGLLPAALLGIDIDNLLKGAASVVESDWKRVLTMSAIYMHYMSKGDSINVLMPYTSRLIKFSEWFCQLWAESLGKKHIKDAKEEYFGTTPMQAYGAVDQHSLLQLFKEGPKDKFYTFLGVGSFVYDIEIKNIINQDFSYLKDQKMSYLLNSELAATELSLLKSDRPSMRINLSNVDAYTLGQLFMTFQYVVSIIGLANDIDPFNQPGVEESKEFTYSLMGKKGYEAHKKEFDELYVKQEQFVI